MMKRNNQSLTVGSVNGIVNYGVNQLILNKVLLTSCVKIDCKSYFLKVSIFKNAILC